MSVSKIVNKSRKYDIDLKGGVKALSKQSQGAD
jgi:hypothetical protein